MSHPLGRDKPTPGDIAGVAGQFLPEELPAHRRMDPVGADQYVAGHLCAVGQRDGELVRRLRESSMRAFSLKPVLATPPSRTSSRSARWAW